MNKVVSFALWGNNKVYNYGLLENISIILDHLPGFLVYVYCTPDVIILDNPVLQNPRVVAKVMDDLPGFRS